MRSSRRHKYKQESKLIKRYEVPCKVFTPTPIKTPTGDIEHAMDFAEDAGVSVLCALVDYSLTQIQQSGGLIGKDDQWVFSRAELPINCVLVTAEGKRYRLKPQGDYTRYGEHYEYHAVSESNAQKYFGTGELRNAWT